MLDRLLTPLSTLRVHRVGGLLARETSWSKSRNVNKL